MPIGLAALTCFPRLSCLEQYHKVPDLGIEPFTLDKACARVLLPRAEVCHPCCYFDSPSPTIDVNSSSVDLEKNTATSSRMKRKRTHDSSSPKLSDSSFGEKRVIDCELEMTFGKVMLKRHFFDAKKKREELKAKTARL
ncbi:unnamed protein product [Ilex paraguariensis]|uniref:Uncharacterized protein n=1 Tax=Ilex paraguariensis TaxID=185542 RepID=A0ABC8U5A2_9AQUA